MKRRGLLLTALAGLVLATSGCAELNRSPESPQSWSEVQVQTQDGRRVLCLVWSGASKGGPSCDWANAKKAAQ
ncbi:hypothetical protein J2S55_009769 [Streptosporangium brasiliense]|uniref:Uncharacterized protein n=1 Tax=Streptosporangium brasiliense TaxID=47480 RepID=A0ABT9RMA7_9ACTN|nr:hypothetical protein [Streptosporangium brasiliense]